MNQHVDIDTDAMEPIGEAAHRVIDRLAGERAWDGKTISENGTYRGISLADYHGKRDLFDAPSISKSALKWLLPTHGGSPKAFWGRWAWNPNRVAVRTTDALDFGRATHARLLGDEDFDAAFAVRSADFKDYKSKAAQEWKAAVIKAGKTPITFEDSERIDRMRADAAEYPLVKLGALDGRIERTMAWKDPETGIWLKARPDAIPAADGVFADLKTAGKFEEDFLEKQIFDACYYLQAAITRMVCRGLGVPFETFVLIYVLNDDVPDTAHVEVDDFDIERGERAVRWCLRTIRRCIDTGDWPGARPFNEGTRRIQMKTWAKTKTDDFLTREDNLSEAA